MKEQKQEHPLVTNNAPEEDDGDDCRMCKFVFAFALTAAFFVIVFTYFFKLRTAPSIEPLPPAQVRPVDDAQWQMRILELEKTMHVGTASSTTPL